MTWIAMRVASLPLGGLLLTWSTFRSIREGRARRAAEELGRNRALVVYQGRIVGTVARP
jgi:hypothetical protein